MKRRPLNQRKRMTLKCLLLAVGCSLLLSGNVPAATISGNTESAAETEEENLKILYSEIYEKEEELPEAEELLTGEDGERWQLKESRVCTVPLSGRKRSLSGQVVYPGVMRTDEIPKQAQMDVRDEESGRTITAELPLAETVYGKERWQEDLELLVTFHSYGADRYRFGSITVPHQAGEPPLSECREELFLQTGLSPEDCRLEAFVWAGETYEDADGILCRDAKVTGSRRVWDCTAVYRGETELPDVIYYRREMRYERMEEDVSAASEASAGEGEHTEAVFEEDAAKASEPWERFLRFVKRHAVVISIGLFFLTAAAVGCYLLFRQAAKLDRGDKN